MKTSTPPLTEKDARALGKQIVKDGKNVRVKFGRTNGRVVLHVYVPGTNLSRTIDNAADWESHPANERARRNSEFAKTEATEKMMASNNAMKDTA